MDVGGSACQPADAAGATELTFNLGTFNFGLHQSMLEDKPFRKHRPNLERVLGKLITYGDLDMLVDCESGGHGQGRRTRGLKLDDILANVVGKAFCVQQGAYIVCWGSGDDWQAASGPAAFLNLPRTSSSCRPRP